MEFKEVIKSYLDNRALEDDLFCVSYTKENKSIDECCKYILSEARKKGNAVCMSDDEVYGLAVHYYDEDDIVIEDAPRSYARTPIEEVELTEEDKEIAKKRAIERYSSEVLASMKKKPKKAESVQQMSLF